MSASEADVEAMQTTLAGEHAAVHVYGVLGARTSQSAQPTLFETVRSAYVEHRDRRDELVGLVAAAGAEPVGAAVAYAVPAPDPGLDPASPAAITAAALAVERACAATYAAQVGTSVDDTRRRAVGWLGLSAVRALALGGTPEALPGVAQT